MIISVSLKVRSNMPPGDEHYPAGGENPNGAKTA